MLQTQHIIHDKKHICWAIKRAERVDTSCQACWPNFNSQGPRGSENSIPQVVFWCSQERHWYALLILSLKPIPITLEKQNFKESKLLNEDVNNSPGAKPFVCTGEHIWCVGYVHVFITQPLGKGLIEPWETVRYHRQFLCLLIAFGPIPAKQTYPSNMKLCYLKF